MNHFDSVHAIVLAAGCSSRLGRNKQLVTLGGQPLVRRAVTKIIAAGVRDITVVVGYQAELVAAAVAGCNCTVAFNASWAAGMGASLQFGVDRAREKTPLLQWLLVALPDQYRVELAHYQALLGELATKPPLSTIVATSYAGGMGVPVLLHVSHFLEIAALAKCGGAKSLIMANPERVVSVANEAANWDLDTPQDLQDLIASGLVEPAPEIGEVL